MAAFTIANVPEVLKSHFQDPVREELNDAHLLLKMVRRTDRNFYGGKEAVLALHTAWNNSVASVGESATLPDGGGDGFANAKFFPKYHYVIFEITGPGIAATRNKIGAYLNGLKATIKGTVMAHKQDLQRQCWGNGSCILTGCTADNNNTDADINVNSTKFLAPGMNIMVAEMDDGANAQYLTISSVVSDTNVTLTGAKTAFATTNFAVYRAKSVSGALSASNRDPTSAATWAGDSSNGTNEIWGLRAIVSNANPGAATNPFQDSDHGMGPSGSRTTGALFGNLSRATNSFWQANTLTNSGTLRDLSVDLLQQALDQADILSGKVPGAIFTSHAMARRVAALAQTDKRYGASGSVTLDPGYGNVAFAGVPIYKDKSAGGQEDPSALNGLYFVHMDSLEMQVLEDWHWLSAGGGDMDILDKIKNKDAWEATHALYANLGAEACNRHTWLGDVSEAA